MFSLYLYLYLWLFTLPYLHLIAYTYLHLHIYTYVLFIQLETTTKFTRLKIVSSILLPYRIYLFSASLYSYKGKHPLCEENVH